MAVEENSPEKRNLVVLSLSIIVYYLAGGYFKTEENELQLGLINIHYTKPEMLAWLIWIMLFWFLFRYWLKTHEAFKNSYFSELHCKEYGFTLFKWYFLRKVAEELIVGDRYFHWYYDNRVKTPLGIIYAEAKWHRNRGASLSHFELQGAADNLVVGLISCYVFFRKPSLSEFLSPYFLFTLAIFLGATN